MAFIGSIGKAAERLFKTAVKAAPAIIGMQNPLLGMAADWLINKGKPKGQALPFGMGFMPGEWNWAAQMGLPGYSLPGAMPNMLPFMLGMGMMMSLWNQLAAGAGLSQRVGMEWLGRTQGLGREAAKALDEATVGQLPFWQTYGGLNVPLTGSSGARSWVDEIFGAGATP